MIRSARKPIRVARSRLARRARHGSAHYRQEGAAAVEFALVLPLFAVLLMGMVDFGHLFFVKSVMTDAAHEGARHAAVLAATLDSDGSIDWDITGPSIESDAESRATYYLDAAGLGVGQLDHPNAVASFDKATGEITVTLTIDHPFNNITGFSYAVIPGFSNPFAALTDLTAVSHMRYESF
jgi:Flp pilus assembly protein TadG